jgi:carbon storage regulator CsrA
MLVLTRKVRESVRIGGPGGRGPMITFTVLEVNGKSVRLGFEADSDVPIHRAEVWARICADGASHRLKEEVTPPVA